MDDNTYRDNSRGRDETEDINIKFTTDTSELQKAIGEVKSFRQELNKLNRESYNDFEFKNIDKSISDLDTIIHKLDKINEYTKNISSVEFKGNSSNSKTGSNSEGSSEILSKLVGDKIGYINDSIQMLDSIGRSFKAFSNGGSKVSSKFIESKQTTSKLSGAVDVASTIGSSKASGIVSKAGDASKIAGSLVKVASKAFAVVAAIGAVYKAMDLAIKKGKESYKLNQDLENSFKNLGSAAKGTADYLDEVNNADIGNIYKAAQLLKEMSDISITKGISSQVSSEISTVAYQLASDIQAANGYTESLEDIYRSIESAISGNTDDLTKYGIQASEEYVKAFVRNTKGVDLFNVDVSESTMQIETLNAVLYQAQKYNESYTKSIGSVGYEMQRLEDESVKLKQNTAELFEPLLSSLLKLFNGIVSGINDMVSGLNSFIDKSSNFLSGNGFVESQVKTEGTLGSTTDAINEQTQALIKEGEQADKLKNKLLSFDRVNVLGGLYDKDPEVSKYTGGIKNSGGNNTNSGGAGFGGFDSVGTGWNNVGILPEIEPNRVFEYAVELVGVPELVTEVEYVREMLESLEELQSPEWIPLIDLEGFNIEYETVKNILDSLISIILPGYSIYLLGKELFDADAESIKQTIKELSELKIEDIKIAFKGALEFITNAEIIDEILNKIGEYNIDVPIMASSAYLALSPLVTLYELLKSIDRMKVKISLDSTEARGIISKLTDMWYKLLNAIDRVTPILSKIGKFMVGGSLVGLAGVGAVSAAPAIGGAVSAGASSIGGAISSGVSSIGSYAAGFGATFATVAAHADGGITTKASLGIIGEAGAEAVIPLTSSRGREAMKQIADAANEGSRGKVTNKTYNININAGNIIEDEYTIRQFCSKIRDTIADLDNSDGNISIGLGV